MKKRLLPWLSLLLLAAVLLSSCLIAVAADSTDIAAKTAEKEDPPEAVALSASPEEEARAGEPLPSVYGFDHRNIYVTISPENTHFTVTILHALLTSSAGQEMRYGVASYDKATGKAADMAGQQWQKPDSEGRVVIQNVIGQNIIVTATDLPTSRTLTAAGLFNSKNIGIKFVLPADNVYDLMEAVEDTDFEFGATTVTIHRTKPNQEYALFNSREGDALLQWQKGTGGDITFSLGKMTPASAIPVTRVYREGKPPIIPITPPLVPGADLARTETGFSQRFGMGVLTIHTTPGLVYAVAARDGHILNIQERLKWGITAEAEVDINIMADETNFYSPPLETEIVQFRVPPGGEYYIVTRLPDGSTAKADKPYQTPATEGNVQYWGPYKEPRTGKLFLKIVIQPASVYSTYAQVDRRTGSVLGLYKAQNDRVEFNTYLSRWDLEIQAFPIPLDPESESGPGQASPGQKVYPPVLSKTMEGTGETAEGKLITVEPWSNIGTPFADGDAVVKGALESSIGRGVDPATLSGAILASITAEDLPEPITLVLFYNWDGELNPALYYFNGGWYMAALSGGEYQLDFWADNVEGTVSIKESPD